ncbi:MAG: hypothetical protein ABWK01_06435, partial [Infirmifilum sp.]
MSHVEWRKRLRDAEENLLRTLDEFLNTRGSAWGRGVPAASGARVDVTLQGAFVFPEREPTLVLKQWSPMVKLSLTVKDTLAVLDAVWVDLNGVSTLSHEGVGRVLDSVAALEVLNPGLIDALRRGELTSRGDPSHLEAILQAAEGVARGYREALALPDVGPLSLLCVEAWRDSLASHVLVGAAGEKGLSASRPFYTVVLEKEKAKVDLRVEYRNASG